MNAAPKLPAIIASRYLPVRLIAKGGMGAVYEVEHARTGEHLALKVLHSGVGASLEALERFKREARASARIKSEHVVRVIDADVAPELDGAPFLVMELLEGADLERRAVATRPSPATVVDWLRQVSVAIDKAHRLGIVHRDLKPENLFLSTSEDRPPIVKILDFGIVKMSEHGTGATGSGQILGTPMYMAPEQASATPRITPATDHYALGLVAYRLLAGESYYRGDVISILAQLLHQPPGRPSERHPELGAPFDAWFGRACHRSPDERFQSACEQVDALSTALGLPATAIRMSAENGSGSRSRRRSIVLGVLAAGSIAAVAIYRLAPTVGTGGAASAAVTAPVPRPLPSATPPASSRPALAPAPAPTADGTPPAAGDSRHGPPLPRPATHHAAAAPAMTPTPRTPAPDPYADQK